MVAVDDDRNPVLVPQLRPFSPDERRLHAAAEMRKRIRQEFEERYSEIKTGTLA